MEIYNNSMIAKAGRAWERALPHSAVKKLWDSFCLSPDPAENSIYKSLLLKIEALVLAIGGVYDKSLVKSFLVKLKLFYFRLSEGSAVLSAVNRLSVNRWLLLFFGAYLPIEYILRDMLHLGIASSWEELFMLLSAAVIIFQGLHRENRGIISRAVSLESFLLLYMGVGLFLLVWICPIPRIAIAGYRAQFQYIIWFFLLLRLAKNRSDAAFGIYAFLGVVFILSLHGIYQYIIGVEIPSTWLTHTESGVRTRVFSLTGSPNIFGSLLVMAAPIAAALMYYAEKKWQKLVFLGITGCICLCDLFTFSRGSWVGLVAAIIIFSLYVDGRIIALAGLAMSAILLAVPSITNRITFLFTDDYAVASAAGGRSMRWEAGRNLLFSSSKWTGFGLGRFGGAVAMNNQVLDKTEEFSYFYMDNYYLKTLVETGIIGLSAFILALLCFIVAGFKAIKKAGKDHTANEGDKLVKNIGNDGLICVGVFSGLVGVLIHCFFENIFEEPYMMAYFWGLAALMCVMGFFRGECRGQQ